MHARHFDGPSYHPPHPSSCEAYSVYFLLFGLTRCEMLNLALSADRGQGFQHSITDVAKYVDSLVQLREAGWDAATRARLIGNYDSEMVERGAKAVQQSLQEAEKSLDLETIGKMLMVTKGHGEST